MDVLKNDLTEHVHVLWGISKDLGASGLRMGVLYSQNQALLKSAQGMNNFYQVSNQVQETVAGIKQGIVVIHQYILATLVLDTSYQQTLPPIHTTNTHYQYDVVTYRMMTHIIIYLLRTTYQHSSHPPTLPLLATPLIMYSQLPNTNNPPIPPPLHLPCFFRHFTRRCISRRLSPRKHTTAQTLLRYCEIVLGVSGG